MVERLKDFYNALRNNKETLSIFTDLDLTTCNKNNPAYAEANGDGSYMQPEIRKSFAALRSKGAELYIVTGRDWADYYIDDVSGQKKKGGALYDLLGGDKSEFKNCKVIAGHGRTITKNGKTNVIGRTKGKELVERKFASYVGKRVLRLKQTLFQKYPDMRGKIEADFKKHLSFVNVKQYVKGLKDQKLAEEINNYIRKQMTFIVNSQDENGNLDSKVPQNPDNIFKFIEEPTGSMEIRAGNWTKKHGIIASGFLEEALKKSGPVMVMGDSLGKNGTDRDLFSAANEIFTKNNARDRLFLIQVVNNEHNGLDKQIYDADDPCKPDIAVSSPDYLGIVLGRAVKESLKNNIKNNISNIILNNKKIVSK